MHSPNHLLFIADNEACQQGFETNLTVPVATQKTYVLQILEERIPVCTLIKYNQDLDATTYP